MKELIEKAYDELELIDKQYDYITQNNRKRIDYLIAKRKLICDRIHILKKELELDEKYKMEESKEDTSIDWNEFILDCLKQQQGASLYWLFHRKN